MGTVVSRHPPPTSSHQHINITLFVAASCHPQSVLLGAASFITRGWETSSLSLCSMNDCCPLSKTFLLLFQSACNCYHLVCAAHGASVGTMQGAGGGSVWRMGLPWSQPVISSCSPPAPARPAVTQTRGIETLSISWLRNTELMRLSTKVGMNSCAAGAWCMEAGW